MLYGAKEGGYPVVMIWDIAGGDLFACDDDHSYGHGSGLLYS